MRVDDNIGCNSIHGVRHVLLTICATDDTLLTVSRRELQATGMARGAGCVRGMAWDGVGWGSNLSASRRCATRFAVRGSRFAVRGSRFASRVERKLRRGGDACLHPGVKGRGGGKGGVGFSVWVCLHRTPTRTASDTARVLDSFTTRVAPCRRSWECVASGRAL